MSLYTPNPVTGIMHGEAPELDRKLREGDNLFWKGDPRLSLHMAVLTAKRSGYDDNLGRVVRKGDILARRYEVWRHNEDGTDTLVGHWRLEEFDKIILDLVGMDPRTPGHVPVEERLDKADAELEKQKSYEFREAMGPLIEHAMSIAHDTTQPKHTFRQVGGLKEEKSDAGNAAE